MRYCSFVMTRLHNLYIVLYSLSISTRTTYLHDSCKAFDFLRIIISISSQSLTSAAFQIYGGFIPLFLCLKDNLLIHLFAIKYSCRQTECCCFFVQWTHYLRCLASNNSSSKLEKLMCYGIKDDNSRALRHNVVVPLGALVWISNGVMPAPSQSHASVSCLASSKERRIE